MALELPNAITAGKGNFLPSSVLIFLVHNIIFFNIICRADFQCRLRRIRQKGRFLLSLVLTGACGFSLQPQQENDTTGHTMDRRQFTAMQASIRKTNPKAAKMIKIVFIFIARRSQSNPNEPWPQVGFEIVKESCAVRSAILFLSCLARSVFIFIRFFEIYPLTKTKPVRQCRTGFVQNAYSFSTSN